MKIIKSIIFTALISIFVGCANNDKKSTETKQIVNAATDPHSYANENEAVVKHLDLNLKVDFNTKQLSGVATWTIENLNKTDEIVFDTKGLTISKVLLDHETENTFYVLGDEDKILGQALSIQIKPDTKKITIYYTTSKDAAALQWLNPTQTAGKKQPFLFTQSQAILARSWIPTQDSPGIRFTYTADIEVPKELLALMSAENPQQKNQTGKYHFNQTHPIPSYLMALAVGDIGFKKISANTAVYAEPGMLDKVAYEFADMGKMVAAAEKLYGKYRWRRYDILVLPPSFPFGGMENPMLTFATPTVIAGDRSLVSLVAHELAHSWSGNLVTNATWNDFWLNEGFTVYLERRIIEELYGKEEAKMLEVLGYQNLVNTVKDLGLTSPDTRLKVDFTDRDPDEGVSDIAYEKGYFFLKNIENTIGRAKLDTFLNNYFNKYAFKSITVDQFINELNTNVIAGNDSLKNKINTYAWVYQPGLPKDFVAPISTKFQDIAALQVAWLKNNNTTGIKSSLNSTNEKLFFINTLPASISLEQMAALDKEFKFTQSGNAEIQSAWYTLAVKKNYKPAYLAMEKFLIQVGRRKFLTPIYKALIETTEGKALAKKIYARARPNYHSVAYNTFDELLK